MTFVSLSRGCELPLDQAVARLLPTYCALLQQLAAAGAPEVQLHEPVLATSEGAGMRAEFETAYAQMAQVSVLVCFCRRPVALPAVLLCSAWLPDTSESCTAMCFFPGRPCPYPPLRPLTTHAPPIRLLPHATPPPPRPPALCRCIW